MCSMENNDVAVMDSPAHASGDVGVQPAEEKVGPVTDLRRWRLTSVIGRQTWAYVEEEEGAARGDQSFVELHSLGLDTMSTQLVATLTVTTSTHTKQHYQLLVY